MVLNILKQSSRSILEIDTKNIVHNYQVAIQNAKGANVACVVKANAYGLGDAEVAKALYAAGCRDFYVAYLEEGLHIAEHIGQDSNIYILCSNTDDEYKKAIECGFVQVLNTRNAVERYKSLGTNLPCVIHFDTGMTRAGLDLDEAENLDLSNLDVRYVMSHLACADEKEHPLNKKQLLDVKKLKQIFPNAKISFANSSGIFLGPEYHFDQVRPGCMLYGVNPTPYESSPVRNVVMLKAKVLQIRTLKAPKTVSYAARHKAPEGSKIATIACGYADGYHRTLSFHTTCYANNTELPIVGTITMDMIMVDVSRLGDDVLQDLEYVELINDNLTVDDIAKKAKTIGYEVLTSLGNRFNRIYK